MKNQSNWKRKGLCRGNWGLSPRESIWNIQLKMKRVQTLLMYNRNPIWCHWKRLKRTQQKLRTVLHLIFDQFQIWFNFFLLPQSLNNGRCYSIFIVGRLCTLLLSSYSVSVGFAHFNAFLFVGELAAILGRCSSAQHFHLSQRRIDWLTPDADGIFDELLCNSTDYLRELICNRCFVIINQCSHIVENRCNSWQFSFFNSIYFLFALALSVLIKSNQTR